MVYIVYYISAWDVAEKSMEHTKEILRKAQTKNENELPQQITNTTKNDSMKQKISRLNSLEQMGGFPQIITNIDETNEFDAKGKWNLAICKPDTHLLDRNRIAAISKAIQVCQIFREIK